MEILSPEFLSALAAIIVIDLALAGDNAIVIALAARSLPAHLQRKAIFWGTAGAIGVRVLMTMAVVWLLGIPGLMAAGGAILVWIAAKLLKGSEGDSHSVKAAATFWGAMQTIVIADAAMGLDNVLAVAGAAHGSFALVVIGLLISIPIVVWGSTLILKWVERYPWIVQIGVAVLAFTAAKMIVSEPLFAEFFAAHEAARILVYAAVFVAVFGWGFAARSRAAGSQGAASAPSLPVLPERSHGMKTLLVPVDGTAKAMAAVRAALAGGPGSIDRIELVNVQPRLPRNVARFLSGDERRQWREEKSRQALAPARRLVETAGIACGTHMAVGRVEKAIADTASRVRASEIVVGAARRGLLGRLFSYSLSTRLLQSSVVPVRVIPLEMPSALERVGVPVGLGLALAFLAIED
jgi:YjbE family integral membrane protein